MMMMERMAIIIMMMMIMNGAYGDNGKDSSYGGYTDGDYDLVKRNLICTI